MHAIFELRLPLATWGVTQTTWTVLWIALASITGLLVWMFRTRWRDVRPWRKCAVLSLWVHVLLACLATTVQIVSGSAGQGPDQPIRVAVMPIEIPPCPLAEAEAREPWEETDAEPSLVPPTPPLPDLPVDALTETPPADETEQTPDETAAEQLPSADTPPKPPSPAPPLEAPSLLPAPPPEPAAAEPAETAAETTSEPAADAPAKPTNEPTNFADDQAADNATAKTPDNTEAPPAEETPTRRSPPLPAVFAARFAENRGELVRRGGGNEHTEQAVRSALAWLAGAQSDDGRWDASRHGAGHERVVLGHNRQGAGGNSDAGVTGLALLAFLGNGQTHHRGVYTRQVAEGLEFLRRTQSRDGALFGDAQFFARMYCHSMATFAAAEALAMTRDDRLRPVVDAATRYSLACQHPSDGGWRYRPGNTGDTSQLGWQLMALGSAELAGLELPESTWTRVERFLRRVRRGPQGGLAAYRPEAPPSRSMTAEAWYCRQLLAGRYQARVASTAAGEARASLLRTLPSRDSMNLYYWYYATLALHHARKESPAAAAAWERWNEALVRTLLSSQQKDGSWAATTLWGGYGGRVYTTAMAALCLEVYYRYAPAEPTEVARGWRAGGRR